MRTILARRSRGSSGITLLSHSIEEPLRQIVENAGEDTMVVLNAVEAGNGAYGYNAGTGEHGAHDESHEEHSHGGAPCGMGGMGGMDM